MFINLPFDKHGNWTFLTNYQRMFFLFLGKSFNLGKLYKFETTMY